VIRSEEWRVNRFDYRLGILSNYQSAVQVQVTSHLDVYLTGLWVLRLFAFLRLAV
jgi:hypothetical protein